jgi:hypothetical protein
MTRKLQLFDGLMRRGRAYDLSERVKQRFAAKQR